MVKIKFLLQKGAAFIRWIVFSAKCVYDHNIVFWDFCFLRCSLGQHSNGKAIKNPECKRIEFIQECLVLAEFFMAWRAERHYQSYNWGHNLSNQEVIYAIRDRPKFFRANFFANFRLFWYFIAHSCLKTKL